MTQVSTRARSRPAVRISAIYAGAWALLATAALAYMAVLATQPGLLGAFAPLAPVPGTGETERTVARFATDIGGLRQTVGDIQQDVSSLQTKVAASTERGQELATRLSVVEERIKQSPVAAATVPAVPKTAAQRQAEARAQKLAQRSAALPAQPAPVPTPDATTPAPAERITVLNAPAVPVSPIATGSLQAPPPPAQGLPAPLPVVSFGPGAIKAAPPPSAVELASGASLDALRLNWSLLADKHASNLKNLEARYMSAGEGQPYQLVAGPIGTPEEAARVCTRLKAKGVPCRVTGFGGNAL